MVEVLLQGRLRMRVIDIYGSQCFPALGISWYYAAMSETLYLHEFSILLARSLPA